MSALKSIRNALRAHKENGPTPHVLRPPQEKIDLREVLLGNLSRLSTHWRSSLFIRRAEQSVRHKIAAEWIMLFSRSVSATKDKTLLIKVSLKLFIDPHRLPAKKRQLDRFFYLEAHTLNTGQQGFARCTWNLITRFTAEHPAHRFRCPVGRSRSTVAHGKPR